MRKRKFLIAQVRKLERKRSSQLVQELLDATTNVDCIADAQTAFRLLQQVRLNLRSLSAIQPDTEFKKIDEHSKPRKLKFSAVARHILEDLFQRGEMRFVPQEERQKVQAREERRLSAKSTSILLTNMLEEVETMQAADFESVKDGLYELRLDAEYLATTHPGVVFKRMPRRAGLQMTETAQMIFADLFCRGEIVREVQQGVSITSTPQP